MSQRLILVCAAALVLLTACGAGAVEKTADGAIAARLLHIFEGAADPADARRRAQAVGVRTDDYGVRVDIQTRDLDAQDRTRFDQEGVHIRHFSAAYQRVAASVRDLQALRALARLEFVRTIAPEFGAGEHGGGAEY